MRAGKIIWQHKATIFWRRVRRARSGFSGCEWSRRFDGAFAGEALTFGGFGEGVVDGHREEDGDEAPKGGAPIAVGGEEVADDGGRGPGNVDDGFADEVGGHQEVGEGGEEKGVEDVGDHEDWVQDNGEAEEDGFVDLENLSGETEARDFAEAGFAGVDHDQREGD